MDRDLVKAAAAPKAEAPVTAALLNLDAEISVLENNLMMLIEKMAPILPQTTGPGLANDSDTPPLGSSMSYDSIQQKTNKVNELTMHIRAVSSMIEI